MGRSDGIEYFTRFPDLPALADHLRRELENKKAIILLYAYNSTGKTRLSMAFTLRVSQAIFMFYSPQRKDDGAVLKTASHWV